MSYGFLLSQFYHMVSPDEEYERTWEQEEELGLHQMDTTSADAAYES
jgi:hypothetical protein